MAIHSNNRQKTGEIMETIKIKYFCKDLEKVAKIDKGDWIDLRAAQEVTLKVLVKCSE